MDPSLVSLFSDSSEIVNHHHQATSPNFTHHQQSPYYSPNYDVSITPISQVHPRQFGYHLNNVAFTPQSTSSPSSSADLGYYSASSSSSNSPWTPHSLSSGHYSDCSSPLTSFTPPYFGSFPVAPPTEINSRLGSYTPGRELPVNSQLVKHTTCGKSTMWFFLLKLLIDPTKKSVIAWTGKGMEFRIFHIKVLAELRSRDDRSSDVETVKRNIRNCYRDEILRQTTRKTLVYEFITEPSIHVRMTRKMLRIYIALNHINGPLTTGEPIDFSLPSCTFPRGTRLQVNRLGSLHEDGSPVVIYPLEYCEVTLVENIENQVDCPLSPDDCLPINSSTFNHPYCFSDQKENMPSCDETLLPHSPALDLCAVLFWNLREALCCTEQTFISGQAGPPPGAAVQPTIAPIYLPDLGGGRSNFE